MYTLKERMVKENFIQLFKFIKQTNIKVLDLKSVIVERQIYSNYTNHL